MRSCKSSMESATLRAAARALIMKKAAARPKTYISPYHRRAIGPSRIRMGSMSGFGNTRGHPTDVEDSFQVHPAQLRLDAGTGFRYIRQAGQGVGEDEPMPLDGGKAYGLYDAMRRMLEPLRRDWEKFTPAEREVIITELEAFLRSVKRSEERRVGKECRRA